MKHLPRIASIVSAVQLFLLQPCGAQTAGSYDGEWAGSATSTGGRCQAAAVMLSVQGKVVTGQARFQLDTPNINGTVMEDGTLGATIGFQHLRGKFVRDGFEGTFESSGCAWRLVLERKR